MKADKPIFVVDSAVIKDFLDSKDNSDASKVLNRLAVLKKDANMRAFTDTNSVLRAIWQCSPDVKIERLQILLETITVMPMPYTNYKDKYNYVQNVLLFAKMVSNGGKNVSTKNKEKI